MKRRLKYSVLFPILLTIATGSTAWSTEVISEPLARSISSTVQPFVVAGGLALISDKHEFMQGAKAVGATCLATSILKRVVNEKRPNTDSLTSFPSGHTSTAFAMATVLAEYKPQYKWPAYTLASAIGFSRVEAGSHYWKDVAAGALLGHYIARHFTKERIVVSPEGVGVQWKY
ncbi:MAG: phosphatase PAP2 family protein [Armatimonadota bacterium]|jgi:membrane-associated phospholipid phosphatase